MSIRGSATLEAAVTGGGAQAGRRRLTARVSASTPGNSVGRLSWPFPKPQDWSAFAGVSFWYRSLDDGSPHPFHLIVSEKKRLSYRCPVSPRPRMAGQWQQVAVPFSGMAWSWEGAEDPDHTFNREYMTGIHFDFAAAPGVDRRFALDDLSLYKPQVPYSGPQLILDSDRYLADPGDPMRCRVSATGLPSGIRAVAEVRVRDCTGRSVREARLLFRGSPDGSDPPQTIAFTGRGYYDMEGVLRVAGRPA
ncbi:MAG: hypothetical protein IT210_03560 [Armatimonadetes bacterium]|nr:hypothetical protein [Armatimonadota bacterium]